MCCSIYPLANRQHHADSFSALCQPDSRIQPVHAQVFPTGPLFFRLLALVARIVTARMLSLPQSWRLVLRWLDKLHRKLHLTLNPVNRRGMLLLQRLLLATHECTVIPHGGPCLNHRRTCRTAENWFSLPSKLQHTLIAATFGICRH
jgi:hypothetical protein